MATPSLTFSRTGRTRAGTIVLALASFLIVAGCDQDHKTRSHPAGSRQSGIVEVVATTGMVADLVEKVGGDTVRVQTLMGPGVDPHLYKASPSDIRALEGADIVFVSGLHLEGKMGELIEKLGARSRVVAVTDSIPHDRLMGFSGAGAGGAGGEGDAAVPGAGAHDPHVWFDVSMWSQCLPGVSTALAEKRPQDRARYDAARTAYEKELTALHDEVRAAIGTIPKEHRVLVTAHDAFGYFSRAYDIEVLSVQGMSTESEASLKDINTLVDTLVGRKIPAVFVESSVSTRNIDALRQGAASKGHTVAIGGQLYSDAMGAANTPEGTYVGMVRANVRTIVDALK